MGKIKVLRLIVVTYVLIFFVSINSFAQTVSYLEDEIAPGSIEDIVKLLNLNNAKRISIFSQEQDTSIFLGEILLNQDGKCLEKRSLSTSHKYDNEGKLIEKVFFGDYRFEQINYKYNKNGDLIEAIIKDESGTVIETDSNTLLILSISFNPSTPRYIDNGLSSLGVVEKYTYDSIGLLTKYFSKGFYLPSSKSRAEDEFRENEIEYRYKYNTDNQIIKYYRKLITKSRFCEVTTEFNYVNDHLIELKSNDGCRCFMCPDKLLYKIEYYNTKK